MPHLYNEYVLVSGEADNDTDFPVQQITYDKRVSNVHMMFPFGLYGNVKTGISLGVLGHAKGQDDNTFCFSAHSPLKRPRDLANGELAVYHPDTGTFIKFRNNGDLEIDTGNSGNGNVIINCGQATVNASNSLSFNTPEASFTGNVDIGGNFNCGGAATLGGALGQPIARVGDAVTVGGSPGTITGGSTTHKAT